MTDIEKNLWKIDNIILPKVVPLVVRAKFHFNARLETITVYWKIRDKDDLDNYVIPYQHFLQLEFKKTWMDYYNSSFSKWDVATNLIVCNYVHQVIRNEVTYKLDYVDGTTVKGGPYMKDI